MFFWIGLALTAVATYMKSNAQKQAGQAEQMAANYEATLAGRKADYYDQQAGQYRAASQRQAIEDRRQADIAASRARAVAGASGADVSGETVARNYANIGYEGELRALTSIYQGESAAKNLEYQATLERGRAAGLRYSGKVSKDLAGSQANQTLIGGAGQIMGGLYGKYG